MPWSASWGGSPGRDPDPDRDEKGRSGWILEVICQPNQADTLSKLILSETSAFGIRRHRMERLILERHHKSVTTPYGEIAVKVGTLGGKSFSNRPNSPPARRQRNAMVSP